MHWFGEEVGEKRNRNRAKTEDCMKRVGGIIPLRIGVVEAKDSEQNKKWEGNEIGGRRSFYDCSPANANRPARSYINVMPLAVHAVR